MSQKIMVLIFGDIQLTKPLKLILNVPYNNGIILLGHSNDTTVCVKITFVFTVIEAYI